MNGPNSFVGFFGVSAPLGSKEKMVSIINWSIDHRPPLVLINHLPFYGMMKGVFWESFFSYEQIKNEICSYENETPNI